MNQPFDAGRLADDLQKLIHEAENLLRSTAVEGSEKTADAHAQAQDTVRALRERLTDLEKDLKGRARVLDSYVQENPWAAVAVTGGVALVLGLLLGRK